MSVTVCNSYWFIGASKELVGAEEDDEELGGFRKVWRWEFMGVDMVSLMNYKGTTSYFKALIRSTYQS